MAISDANSSNASRVMVEESSRKEPEPQYKIQNLQSRWEDRKNGKMISMISLDWKETKKQQAIKKAAKDQKAWKKMESKFATMTAAAPDIDARAEEQVATYDVCCRYDFELRT